MIGPETEAAKKGEAAEEARAAPASPKGFRLRGELPRVMRLSRKALVSIGAATGLGIGGAIFWALQPAVPQPPENLYRAEARSRAELVAGAVDYSALSEPGPSSLGARPIAAEPGSNAPLAAPGAAVASPAERDPAAEARERAAQERAAARSSRLFLGGSAGADERAAADVRPPAENELAVVARQDGTSTSAPARKPFLAGRGAAAESLERMRDASSPNILQAGSVIPAALITGIRSDLPGQVTAQVTQNIYDSPTGRTLLIPQGARLVGAYDSEIAAGQDRVLLGWDRLILPGGRSIELGHEPGVDTAGMAGLSDRTDFHWSRVMRAAFASTLLGIGTELGTDSEDRLVRALREGAQDTAGQTGRQIVERELRVPPTLTIRPGFPLRVLITRDLVLEPVANGRQS
jgi:type IV secretion system protein VirB10